MHGGNRSGSGRPKSENTVMVRVPEGCLDAVRELIASYRLTGVVNFTSVSSVVAPTPTDYESFCVWLRSVHDSYQNSDCHFAYKLISGFYDAHSGDVSLEDFYAWAGAQDKFCFMNGRLLQEAWSNRTK